MVADIKIKVEKLNGQTEISFTEYFDDYKYELGKSLYAAEIISEAFNTDDVFTEVCRGIDSIKKGLKTYSFITDWSNTEYKTKVTVTARVYEES